MIRLVMAYENESLREEGSGNYEAAAGWLEIAADVYRDTMGDDPKALDGYRTDIQRLRKLASKKGET